MAFGRTFLYHHSCPQGFIFTDEDEFKKALKDGWVEAPWLVGKPDPVPVAPVVDKAIKAAKGPTWFNDKMSTPAGIEPNLEPGIITAVKDTFTPVKETPPDHPAKVVKKRGPNRHSKK